MFTRRGFIVGAAGMLAGCRLPCHVASRGVSADCWCAFGERRGAAIDEEAVFGGNGRTGLFPDVRKDLVFLLDDIGRFPFLHGTAAECLAQLDARVRGAGWKGTGIIVEPQIAGERRDAQCEDWSRLEEDLKRRLGESAEGNVAYWRVGDGVHGHDMRYLRLMGELKRAYAPDLVVELGWDVDNALNGRPYPQVGWKPPLLLDVTGSGACRMTDNPLYDAVRRDYEALMEFSDVVRTGGTLFPMCAATALDRAVFAVECADRLGSRAVVGVGDENLIAAALGLGFAMTRAPWSPDPAEGLQWNRGKRMAEASRCVNWHRISPPFGSDCGIRLSRSADRVEESWRFAPGSTWWKAVFRREIRQTAPAVVSRGFPLPEVRGMDPGGDVPFVAAGRNPNGAKSVAAIPIVTQDGGFHAPLASVALDARLERGEPLGVFGEFGELSVTVAGGRPSRVLACDLAGGGAEDITAQVDCGGGRIVLPGKVIDRIGTRQNPTGDESSPGLVLELA